MAKRDGITWSWAIEPRDVYVLAPEAAIFALVADDIVGHARYLGERGEFSFER